MNRRSTDRIVEIELLALDLTTCTRCAGTLENIEKAVAGRVVAARPDTGPCCAPAEQETCCDPGEKAGCCEAAAPAACGCR